LVGLFFEHKPEEFIGVCSMNALHALDHKVVKVIVGNERYGIEEKRPQ